MTMRLDYTRHADVPPLVAMAAMSGYIKESGLDPLLIELLDLRVSQLNGCAYCVDMHTKNLKSRGEQEPRLYMLSVWRETDLYSDAERAALAWAEALTRVAGAEELDACYADLGNHFSEKEINRLIFVVIAINGWNRLNVACGTPAGQYQPGDHDQRVKQAFSQLMGDSSA